ncbi:hypothetical protein EXIGLDRAFT_700942 [Exidia glandulosa HHB12029]|uniref:Uncharacterized protein n=1 Tax=Exidia glandulosa HHB12029 TaxID=1314781 RepID=A0A165D6V3_EXIGL|nr:hypothetical protein EXIGLDRAFT_700942 [Exidia glandulosa HHB12029]
MQKFKARRLDPDFADCKLDLDHLHREPTSTCCAAKTGYTHAGGRAATRAGVVPADAPPGVTRAKNTTFGSFPALSTLLTTGPRGKASSSGANTLALAVVPPGMNPSQAQVLRAALKPEYTLCPRPLSPAQLNNYVNLRKQFNSPVTYEQIVTIRAADAARCGGGHDDDDRVARIHRNYRNEIDERRAVFKLGTQVMFTEATLMDSEANSITVIGTCRAETTATTLDSAEDLNVFFHVSRSITDNGEVIKEYRDAVEEFKALFVDKIAMRHVRNYGQRIVDSGRPNWTNATSLPLSPSAASRMGVSAEEEDEDPIPFNLPTASGLDARARGDSKGQGPVNAYDIFSPQTPQTGDNTNCGACNNAPQDDSIPPNGVFEAYKRAAYHARGAFTPTFPVELTLAFLDDRTRWEAFKAVRDAHGDASLIFSTLLSLGLCGRHALKLASAATEDIFQGFGLIH